MKPVILLAGLVPALLLGGCARHLDFDATGGIKIVRSACPAVAVPTYTGDVTLFDPAGSREARAIDVVATITDVRTTCDGTTDPIRATASFDVIATRRDAGPARDVTLPYFVTVTRAGTVVVSKQIGQVGLHFDQGQTSARTSAQGGATVSQAAATIPAEVSAKINRKRKPGDADASIDPMADPATRAAVQRASFELLVGFQLTNDQLQYNATR